MSNEELVQKVKTFVNWIYNEIDEWKYDGMTEEVVGLAHARNKLEDLGLDEV